MNGGVGYSWFKLKLVNETKDYIHLEGTLIEQLNLQGHLKEPVILASTIKKQLKVACIKEQHLIGTINTHNLIGTLGGDEDE